MKTIEANMTMIKNMVTILMLIIGVIFLSGCIGTKINVNSTDVNITPVKGIDKTINVSIINKTFGNNKTLEVSTKSINDNESPLISSESGWCISKSKFIENEKEFVVIGSMNRNGTLMCIAESNDKGEKTTYEFSQDGRIKKMMSVSLSGNGRSTASVSVSS